MFQRVNGSSSDTTEMSRTSIVVFEGVQSSSSTRGTSDGGGSRGSNPPGLLERDFFFFSRLLSLQHSPRTNLPYRVVPVYTLSWRAMKRKVHPAPATQKSPFRFSRRHKGIKTALPHMRWFISSICISHSQSASPSGRVIRPRHLFRDDYRKKRAPYVIAQDVAVHHDIPTSTSTGCPRLGRQRTWRLPSGSRSARTSRIRQVRQVQRRVVSLSPWLYHLRMPKNSV